MSSTNLTTSGDPFATLVAQARAQLREARKIAAAHETQAAGNGSARLLALWNIRTSYIELALDALDKLPGLALVLAEDDA